MNTHVLLFVENKQVVFDVQYVLEGRVTLNGKEYGIAYIPGMEKDFKLALEAEDLAELESGFTEVTYYYLAPSLEVGGKYDTDLPTDELGQTKVYSQKLEQ